MVKLERIASIGYHGNTTHLQGQSKLFRLRPYQEIEIFRNESTKPIYSHDDLKQITYHFPEIFLNRPHWSIAQMVSYCLYGNYSPSKRKFINQMLNLGDSEIIKYLKSLQGQDELNRLRPYIEVEHFKDSQGQRIYSAETLRSVTSKYPELFTDTKRWTLVQMIEHCLNGKQYDKKVQFIEATRRINDPEVNKYLISKLGKGELYRLRRLKELMDITDNSCKPIYTGKYIPHIKKNWTLAKMIDYCFSGKPTAKKARFIEAIKARIKNNRVIQYIEAEEGKGQLHRLRRYLEIEDFRDESGKPVFHHDLFSNVKRSSAQLMTTIPKWTLAQMIGYCIIGIKTEQRQKFLYVVERIGDPEVNKFLARVRKLSTVEGVIKYIETSRIRTNNKHYHAPCEQPESSLDGAVQKSAKAEYKPETKKTPHKKPTNHTQKQITPLTSHTNRQLNYIDVLNWSQTTVLMDFDEVAGITQLSEQELEKILQGEGVGEFLRHHGGRTRFDMKPLILFLNDQKNKAYLPAAERLYSEYIKRIKS